MCFVLCHFHRTLQDIGTNTATVGPRTPPVTIPPPHAVNPFPPHGSQSGATPPTARPSDSGWPPHTTAAPARGLRRAWSMKRSEQRARRQWLAAAPLSRGGGGYPSRGPHRGGRLRTGTALGAAVGGGGGAEQPGGRAAAVATAISIGVATAAAAAAAIVNVSGDGADFNVARLTAWAAAPRRAASTTTGRKRQSLQSHCRGGGGWAQLQWWHQPCPPPPPPPPARAASH